MPITAVNNKKDRIKKLVFSLCVLLLILFLPAQAVGFIRSALSLQWLSFNWWTALGIYVFAITMTCAMFSTHHRGRA